MSCVRPPSRRLRRRGPRSCDAFLRRFSLAYPSERAIPEVRQSSAGLSRVQISRSGSEFDKTYPGDSGSSVLPDFRSSLLRSSSSAPPRPSFAQRTLHDFLAELSLHRINYLQTVAAATPSLHRLLMLLTSQFFVSTSDRLMHIMANCLPVSLFFPLLPILCALQRPGWTRL